MHSVSDLWRTLLASPGHRKEVKLVIAGVTYGEDKIVDGSLRIDGGLYSDFGIGSCCARQIDFEIYPQGTIPRQANDAMLKAEETWLDSSYDAKTWPMPAATAVADIAARMGVAVDSRTVLDAAFPMQYPADDKGDMTMRETLGRIAVANAGNWTITDEGKLLLVGLNSMPAETHYLITEGGSAITFGGVRILV